MDQFEGQILLPVPRDEVTYYEHPISGFYDGRQIVNGRERTVKIRKYRQSASVEQYFNFLQSLDHYNMFTPNYKLNDNGETIFAFTDAVTCTLRNYLTVVSEEDHLTPRMCNFQRDFTDSLVSILRQIVDAMEFMHENNIFVGDMPLESIFLDLDCPRPRVLILPPRYEYFAKLGGDLPFPEIIDLNVAKSDWLRLGISLTEICAALNMNSIDEALEIFDLSDKLTNKRFNSIRAIRLHPALLFSNRKSAFIVEFYEAVIRLPHYIGKFSYKPPELQQQSWKIYFQHQIAQLSTEKRNEIGRQKDNLYNFIKFVRNTIELSPGHQIIRDNLGDQPTVLRFFRHYYKYMLIDLIPQAGKYREADEAIGRLIQN